MLHYSVLKKEVIDTLNIQTDGIYVDATVGYAGHASEILKRCPKGFLYAFDEDQKAVEYSTKYLASINGNFKIFNQNFASLQNALQSSGVEKVDGIIFDLGFSSPQIDDEKRGFSFMHDGPLDMRMNVQNEKNAKSVVNTYSEEKLTEIFYNYAEEKLSKVIAHKICEVRKNKEILTTMELVEIIKQATGSKYFFKNHPERQIFQAIRIEVNNELEVIEKALPEAINILKPGGRLCVITFHSLEDRITKKIFKKYSEVNELVKGLPNIPDEYKPLIKLINNKPIVPSKEELNENMRSHSAKLRVVERI